jgi:hypothetical protein
MPRATASSGSRDGGRGAAPAAMGFRLQARCSPCRCRSCCRPQEVTTLLKQQLGCAPVFIAPDVREKHYKGGAAREEEGGRRGSARLGSARLGSARLGSAWLGGGPRKQASRPAGQRASGFQGAARGAHHAPLHTPLTPSCRQASASSSCGRCSTTSCP